MNSSIAGNDNYVKSPINYIGGKHKFLDQIIPKFPKEINTFLDLFAGGCNVGINVNPQKLILNDNITFLIDMFQSFYNNDYESIIKHIELRISEFKLSKINEEGYRRFRDFYNQNKKNM